MTKPDLLIIGDYPDWDMTALHADYTVHEKIETLSNDARAQVTAIAFKGHTSLGADVMDALPNLGLIANFGVGFDAIDVDAATARSIRVTNTPDVLTDDVADLAVAMLIARSRDMIGASNWVRQGMWAREGDFPLQRKASGRRVGIVGLGRIGRAIADRLSAFSMDIHYHARAAKDVPDGWHYHADVVAMAEAVDILIVALAGGPQTEGYVDAQAIAALGPDGMLVNISRGTTVDEAALLTALETGTLGSAALDVFRNEPAIDPRFLALDNVLLQPHQASGTVETRQAMGQLQRDNIAAFLAGTSLLTPVN